MRIESIVFPALRVITNRPRLTDLLFSRDPWGNPFSDEAIADPYPVIERMWADGPVSYKRFWGRWFVVGYEECQIVANHPDASAGNDFDMLLAEVRPYKQLAPRTKDFFRQWILIQDGADHTRLRKLVSRPFTPRRIADLESMVAATADELLDAIDGRGAVEMVGAFNRPLPVRVICSMLGFPPERWQWAGDIVARISTFLDPLDSFDVATIEAAVDEFRAYVLELAALRRREPADDLISALVRVEDGGGADGEVLTEGELVANVGLLIFAGHDTTTNMLGNALVALANHPDQRALVRDSPELWSNAVEELLRYDTTAVATARRLTGDIDLGDVVIPAGSSVMLQLNAANRDPRRWDHPGELRLDRPDPRPLSFGYGAHHCLGHALARMELRVALRAAVERLGDYIIEPDGIEWRRSAILRGPSRLVLSPG